MISNIYNHNTQIVHPLATADERTCNYLRKRNDRQHIKSNRFKLNPKKLGKHDLWWSWQKKPSC